MPMTEFKYTVVPAEDVELGDVVDGRRISIDPPPSYTLSSASSPGINKDKKRHNRTKERLNTELLTAVLQSDKFEVVRLLHDGASPDATCRPIRLTASHLASLRGDVLVLDTLLRAGANIALRDRAGRQPIHMAAWGGSLDILSLLLLKGAHIDSPIRPDEEPRYDLDTFDSWHHDHEELKNLVSCEVVEGSTALHLACKKVNVDCVDYLLRSGADVNAKDSKGLTPLDVSGLYHVCNREKTKEQVDNTQDVSKFQRSHSKTFSRESSNEPNFVHKMVNSLIKNGARMPKANIIVKKGAVVCQSKMNVTTLHTAVLKEELELIECLFKNGACVATWNEEGETPMHLAVRHWLVGPLKKMLLLDSSIVDVRDSNGKTPLHLAVEQEWPNGIALLLEAGADVTTTSNTKSTVLHLAAERGNRAILEELLSIPGSNKILEYRNDRYETPLWRAVCNNHLSCMELLCENGADVTITLPGDITLLHIASFHNSSSIIAYLLHDTECKKLKDIRCSETEGGFTALHIAAKAGYDHSVQELLFGRCDLIIRTTDHPGNRSTALHLAAKYGHLKTVGLLVGHDKSTLVATDKDGWQPLHIAAGSGHGNCVRFMLQNGADLSAVIDEGGKKTALDIIMYCVPQPIEFLENIFDSYLEINDLPLYDPDCEINIKYDIIVPAGSSQKQLKVLNAILNSGNQNLQERILLHPLVEIFLYLKWKKLHLFFAVVMALHLLLTFSLTTLAHLSYVEKTSETIFKVCAEIARVILFTSLVPIVIIEIINASQLQKYYFLDYESWIKWAVIVLTSLVGIVDPRLSWSRQLSSVAVLMAWIELLFLLAHFPSWGFYVLMFSRVASNVFKVLGTFMFLVLGFTFAFLILFEAGIPFRNIMEALIKVIVMMLEFDYENMFEQAGEVTAFSIVGRIMFAIFVILVAMVMMNLMVGLAVADIALLEAQGKAQRLGKQAAFLSVLESSVYNGKLKKILPENIYKVLDKRRSVPKSTIIRPARPIHSDSNPVPRTLREAVLNKVWEIQRANEAQSVNSSLDLKFDRLVDIINKKLASATNSITSKFSKEESDILKMILDEQKKIKEMLHNLVIQKEHNKE